MKTELQTNQHLIQEFMGVEKTERLIPYHSCWNHLMSVVDRCTQIGFRDTESNDDKLYVKWDNLFCEDIGQFVGNHIDEVYKAVVQFIKYYNQNK